MEKASAKFYKRTSEFKKEFKQLLDKYDLELCGYVNTCFNNSITGLKDKKQKNWHDFNFIEQSAARGNTLFVGRRKQKEF